MNYTIKITSHISDSLRDKLHFALREADRYGQTHGYLWGNQITVLFGKDEHLGQSDAVSRLSRVLSAITGEQFDYQIEEEQRALVEENNP